MLSPPQCDCHWIGVRGEVARLYRLGLNGRIRSDEMTRFIYALKEIRGCIEPEPPPETLSCIGSVNVVSINQDHFFVDKATARR